MAKRVYISEPQMAILLANSFTAPALFTYARDLAEAAGRQAYWSLLLAAVVSVIPLLCLVRLAVLFPGKTAFEYVPLLFGKVLGSFSIAWSCLLYPGFVGLTLNQFGNLVNTTFLPRTPMHATIFLMLAAAVFIAWHGLEGMVRFVSLVYPVMLGLLVVTFLVGMYRVTETDALLPPVLFDPPTVTRGAWSILYAFVGVESTSTLIACVKAPKHPYRYGFTALGVNFSLLTLILVITLGIWGVVPAARITYPGAVTLRTLRLSGLLVERIGGFVAITWTMLELTFVTTQLLEFAHGIAIAVGAGPERYRYFLIPLSLYMLAMARLPGNPRELEVMITRFVTPMTAGTWLLLVPLLLVLGLIRKRRNAAS